MFTHLSADLLDVPPERLRDVALLRSALVAAASIVGLGALGAPTAYEGTGAVTLALIADGRHVIVHTVPDAGVLLLDVLAPAVQDSQRALDVFIRRLTPGDVRSETRVRPSRRDSAPA